MPRLQKRELLALREMFADVLDVCRVACSKDIGWKNAGDALAYPHQLQARHLRLCHTQARLDLLPCVALRMTPALTWLHRRRATRSGCARSCKT
jgi:hypothetical protein